jgi:hypothetical protein
MRPTVALWIRKRRAISAAGRPLFSIPMISEFQSVAGRSESCQIAPSGDKPARHSPRGVAGFLVRAATGWSSLTTSWGFPCCVRFPCVHAVATTPVQQTGSGVAQTRPSVSAFPVRVDGSACTSSFSRIARRSLTLRPARSRGHQKCDHYPNFRLLNACSGCFRLEHLPGGAYTHWKAPPCRGAHYRLSGE